MINQQKNYILPIVVVTLSALLLSTLILVFGPKKGFILVAGLFIVYFIFRDPRIGLALTIIAILNFGVKGKFAVGAEGLFLSVSKVLGFLTAVSWLFHHLTQRKKLVFTRTMWFGLGFILISLASVVVAPDKKWALIDVSKLIVDYILFFLIVQLLSTTNQVKAFVLVLLLTGFIASSAAIVQVKFPAFQMTGEEAIMKFGHSEGGIKDTDGLKSGSFVRPTGTLGHPNWLSVFLVTLLPLTLYCTKSPDFKKFRYFCFLVLLFQLIAILLTHDRQGFLGVVFVLGLSLWFRMIPVTAPMIVSICLVLFIAPFILPATYLERVFSINNFKKSATLTTRWDFLMAGLDMFSKNPIIGVGAGNYGIVFMRDYSHTETHEMISLLQANDSTMSDHSQAAHNMYVEVSSETGIFGITIFLTFLFGAARSMYKLQQRANLQELKLLPTAFMISILGFGFMGIFQHAQLQKVWWIVIALSVAFYHLTQQQSKLTSETA